MLTDLVVSCMFCALFLALYVFYMALHWMVFTSHSKRYHWKVDKEVTVFWFVQ